MKYVGRALGRDTELSIEREGLRIGGSFLDFADFKAIRPINHRVFIDTLGGDTVEVSMLGFAYDGFLKELCDSFSDRSMEALFVEEKPIMRCEGDYAVHGEKGRGEIILLPDAVCVLPPTCSAVRIPLCFTRDIRLDGYTLRFEMLSGTEYSVGRMGYDTKPFAERAVNAAALTKKKRAEAISGLKLTPPFNRCGLFRTEEPDKYWLAAVKNGRCALELFAEEDSATYLYRFTESEEEFILNLEEAAEAMGIHREIIYLTDEQINEKPLYRMSVARSEAVRFLRSKSDGRLIHNASHEQRLKDYING